MSITRTLLMHCDRCGDAAGAGGLGDEMTIRELYRAAKLDGWKFPVENGKRLHLCIDCAEDREAERKKKV